MNLIFAAFFFLSHSLSHFLFLTPSYQAPRSRCENADLFIFCCSFSNPPSPTLLSLSLSFCQFSFPIVIVVVWSNNSNYDPHFFPSISPSLFFLSLSLFISLYFWRSKRNQSKVKREREREKAKMWEFVSVSCTNNSTLHARSSKSSVFRAPKRLNSLSLPFSL